MKRNQQLLKMLTISILSALGLASLKGQTTEPTKTGDTSAVGEVIVTALGIKKEKKKLGFAVSEIQGSTLVKARETNVLDNMIGKVAGLTIGQNSELLGNSQVVLR